MYLVLCFDKSLPWPVDIHGSKISFYRNIFLSQYREQKCLVCLIDLIIQCLICQLVFVLVRVATTIVLVVLLFLARLDQNLETNSSIYQTLLIDPFVLNRVSQHQD